MLACLQTKFLKNCCRWHKKFWQVDKHDEFTCDIIRQKVPPCRSWKMRYSHFLKRGSKCLIFRCLLTLIEKSLTFYMTFIAIWWHISFLHKNTLFKDKHLLNYTISYCKRKLTYILKNHFLKKSFFRTPLSQKGTFVKFHFLKRGFFQIPFLNSLNLETFSARELGYVSSYSNFSQIVTLAVTSYRQSGIFCQIMSHIVS